MAKKKTLRHCHFYGRCKLDFICHKTGFFNLVKLLS